VSSHSYSKIARTFSPLP